MGQRSTTSLERIIAQGKSSKGYAGAKVGQVVEVRDARNGVSQAKRRKRERSKHL